MASLTDEMDDRKEDRGEYAGCSPPPDGHIRVATVWNETDKAINVSGVVSYMGRVFRLEREWIPRRHVWGGATSQMLYRKGIRDLTIAGWLCRKIYDGKFSSEP